MWPCYGMHITVCLLFVTSSHASLHQLGFLFRNLFIEDLFLDKYFFNLLCGAAHALTDYAYIIHAHALWPTNGVQQLVHSAPSVFPTKKLYELSHGYARNEAQKNHPREFPGYWWLF